jgi:hypothetical protein
VAALGYDRGTGTGMTNEVNAAMADSIRRSPSTSEPAERVASAAISAADAVDLLLPVGFPVGLLPGPAGCETAFGVRINAAITPLRSADYDIWWQARFKTRPGELLEWARSDGIGDAASTVEAMVSEGLLVHITERSVQNVMRRHRLLPLAIGTGQDEPDSPFYVVRDHYMQPLAEVNELAYFAWSLSDGYRSLEDATELAAGLVSADLEPSRSVVAASVELLLSVNAVALDVVEAKS